MVAGNPILTNLLWNEIGRGTDLKELLSWVAKNKNKVDELTTAVFSSEGASDKSGTSSSPENFIGVIVSKELFLSEVNIVIILYSYFIYSFAFGFFTFLLSLWVSNAQEPHRRTSKGLNTLAKPDRAAAS